MKFSHCGRLLVSAFDLLVIFVAAICVSSLSRKGFLAGHVAQSTQELGSISAVLCCVLLFLLFCRHYLTLSPSTCFYQATGGQDNLLRVWVLKDSYAYFDDMRQKYSEGKFSL